GGEKKATALFQHFAGDSDSGVGDRFSDEMPEGREVPPNAVGYEPHEDEFWVSCGKGHTHYGEHGAAGMLIRHTDDEGNHRYLLQKRAPWVDHGNTWGVPGGAIRKGENPEEAAMNETKEEIGHLPGLKPIHRYTDDHDGWAYHTIVAQAPERFNISDADQNDESSGTGWFTREEMNKLPLHPGFASSVDKVIGSVGKTATLNNLFQHFAFTDVAWRKSDDDPWTTHNFDKPVKHTAARDFGPNKGPLPIQHGLYYRVHYTPRKWETEKATSTPGLMYKKQKEEYGDRTEPGYSSFDNPHDLHRYWDGKYWAGEKASTESQHQKHYKNAEDWFNKNHKVVIFKGEEVGRGHDQEPLAQPTHKADRQELSIEEFKKRLSQTPHPDTFDHWHEAEPLDPGGHYWSGNWWHGNGEKCDDAERCREDFPSPSDPEADHDTFAHYWDNHEDDDSVTHTAANEPKPLTKLQEDILYRVKKTGTVDMAKDVHNCRLYGDQQTFRDHLGNIADELGYHNGLKQKDVDAVSKHIENHAQKTLIDAGFPETFSVWRKPSPIERGVLSVTTQTDGTKVFRPANEYKINRSDVLTHGDGFLGDYQSFAEDELHVPLDKLRLVNERTAVLDSWRPNQRLFAPTIGSLDPRLFEDDKIRPEVRNFVMDRLAGLWDGKYDNWREWSRVYLAGSSISEWWADVNAIRDPEIGLTQGYHLNDDLDTLIGVEYGGLVEANPQFAGMSPKKVSAHMNAELRKFCNMEGVYLEIPVERVPEWEWSAQPVAGKVRVGPWGATWYVNPNSYDIRAIKPYAAYDLTRDEWAVRPVQEPTGHQFSPTEWYYFEGVAQEVKGTLALPEPARSRRAKRLWNFIHSTRNKAFT
ncbi:MAG: NUDIX hydrolase, partial [Betaproteobacteria bacterium]